MESQFYSAGPVNVPEGLTRPRASYRRQAILAMLGLSLFMLIYLALTACFALITITHIQWLTIRFDIFTAIVAACSGLLTLFMVRSLFVVRRSGEPDGIEVTEEQQPELFHFIYQLADEVGAPRPHRVFLTPEVNAAVFYDLSLLNLIFPSRKNLIIGLGLVNVVTLGELKAVLAHEFGHFAQRSMMVGRWVYIAQQIIAHMITARGKLDGFLRALSRTDPRIAWVGWLLSLIIWSIRSLVDTLFRLVVIAERALSREMEFNADLVSVSVTGSDALINALHKLQAADQGWQTAISVAQEEASNKHRLTDLFTAQRAIMHSMRSVLNDPQYGIPPLPEEGSDPASHRVFTREMARPPEMWATHPANYDREDNAKATYVSADIDDRSPWLLFNNAEQLRHRISEDFYNPEHIGELTINDEELAVKNYFNRPSLNPCYWGSYLNRQFMRNFRSVDELLKEGTESGLSNDQLYPQELKDNLTSERNLSAEIGTLKALQSGELKPSGGVIRHRDKELQKSEIPQAIKELEEEKAVLAEKLRHHDAACHYHALQDAEKAGHGWAEYQRSLLEQLHACEHMAAAASNEHALLGNTWAVITADGKVGHFEKRRLLRTTAAIRERMQEISAAMKAMTLPAVLLNELGIDDWEEKCPVFDLPAADKHNWINWCEVGHQAIGNIAGVLNWMRNILLDELIRTEEKTKALAAGEIADDADNYAPELAVTPQQYPLLMPGDEHKLQFKLDLWNRFQLAQGIIPTLLRLLVALTIVGGTLFAGLTI